MKDVPEPSERWTTAMAEDGSSQSLAVEHQFARLDAREIDHRHHAAHHGRELDQAVLVELLGLERHVRRAEGHGLGDDLLDAAARTDRLVVHPEAGLFLVGVRPLGIERVGEGGARAGNVGGLGDAGREGRGQAGRRDEGRCHAHICKLP
jgi:hypothetical protein